MNKKRIAVFAVLIALIAAAGCSRSAPVASDSVEIKTDAGQFETIYTGSTDMGDAVVDITPVGVSGGKLTLKIGVNTHSVSLEQFELAKITTLEYNGKNLTPVSAPSLTGHHNSGMLVFDVGEPASSFRITITGIPSVEERIFEWG